MWGVCLDWDLQNKDLFQVVVQYEIDSSNGNAVIYLPVTGIQCDADKIRELSQAPEYVYGEEVSPRKHPDMRGTVVLIRWHFNRQKHYYTIRVAGRIKSKRYFGEELFKI